MHMKIKDWLIRYVNKNLGPEEIAPMSFPPTIATTLGFELVEVGDAYAIIEIDVDPDKHGNPMKTIHGGILCDIADAAIGSAHSMTLEEGETYTSIDLRINFFRPVWKDKLRAVAKVVQLGKTISYYTCDIFKKDGKLVATVTSSLMTLREEKAKGR